MSAVTFANCSFVDNGTTLTVSGTYTPTFSPTAVRLGMGYLATLSVWIGGGSAASPGTNTATVSLPGVIASSPAGPISFSGTVSKNSLDSSVMDQAMDFNTALTANNVGANIILVADIQSFSGYFNANVH